MKYKDFLLKVFEKGLYSCDHLGNIYSHQKRPNDKIAESYCRKMSGSPNSSGYIQILLTDNKVRVVTTAHQVVFLFFNRNADFQKMHINHINNDKHCNRIDNLELVTPSQNFNHALKQDRATKKLHVANVKEIREMAKTLSNKEISKKFMVHERTVYDILKGKTWASV